MNLSGQVGVITGAGSGIGRACALALAREGAHVAVADIDLRAAEETVSRIEALGRNALAVRCDVGRDDEVGALAESVVAALGRVDLLHNHAGIVIGGAPEQVPAAEWERVLSFNVMTQVRGVMTFLPHLRADGGGHVVNTTSSLAVCTGGPVTPMVMPYVTSKAAIVGLTQSMAMWLRPLGVGVSLLAPDNTATGFQASASFYGMEPSEASGTIDDQVAYAIQSPEEVAEVYVAGLRADAFLLSCTPDIAGKLRRQADGLLDPSAMTGAYSPTLGRRMLLMTGTVKIDVSRDDADERRGALLALLRDTATASRAESGNERYTWAADLDDPRVFHLSEVWQDEAALRAHVEQPHSHRFVRELATFGVIDATLIRYDVRTAEYVPSPF